MPTISMFFGILIRMYYAPKEHNPPHIHVYYQKDRAVVSIRDGEVLDGALPAKQLRFVQTWIDIHREDLLADWDLCQNREEPFKIEPLR